MKIVRLASVSLSILCILPAAAQHRIYHHRSPKAKPISRPTPRPAPAAASVTPSLIRLQFVNSDISDVLQAISMKTRANIVYSAMIKRPISLNITTASVREAIGFAASAAALTYKQIGEKFFVAPPADLKQLIESFGEKETLELNGVSSAEAVSLLAGALPYLTARPAGQQILLIGSPEDIAGARSLLARQERPAVPLPLRSEVVTVQRLVAVQAATMIQTLYPGLKAEAVGSAEKAGGAIGLMGSSSQVDAAKEALLKLDAAVPSNAPQKPVYKLYAVKYSSAPVLRTFLEKAMPGLTVVIGPEHYAPPVPGFRPLSGAISGNAAGGGSSSSGSGSGSAGGSASSGSGDASSTKSSAEGDRARALVVSGPAGDVERALHLLEEVDIAPQQVLVEVKVVDISPERAQDLGVKWDWSPLSFLEAPAGTAAGGAQANTIANHLGYFSRIPLAIQATLSAMVTTKEAKILADPRIQVLDNEDANIFIGDTLRTQVSQSGIAGSTVQVFEFPVGIILLVRPRVNADGQITLRVHPVVSTITGVGAGNLPQTSTREAETTVRIKDGETVVIGGLIRDEMSNVSQAVPFLSKLPLVGELFRNTSTSHRHSEIMVFITPHIVK